MPRKLRIQFPGAVDHVLDRGDRREAIFRTAADRVLFLEILSQACGRTGWRVHAYVLMGNHYHLLLETPEPNLVGRDEVAPRNLFDPVQFQAQTAGASLPRPLQGSAGRSE